MQIVFDGTGYKVDLQIIKISAKEMFYQAFVHLFIMSASNSCKNY